MNLKITQEHFELDDEKEKLEEVLKKLINEGINKSDITILSPYRFDNSVASKITKYKISSINDNDDNITHSTIQGFKGLENTVIIITDIKTYNSPDLMYVAMSRARSLLIVFEIEHATEYRQRLQVQNNK